MADTAPVLIWISDVNKKCYFFNAGWLRFTGRTLEEEYGDGWAEGVHPDDMQRCLDIYNGSFDARREFKMEYRLRRHDGEYRWVVDNGVPRYATDGTFAGYIGSCMDIDDLLESDRVQDIRNKDLEESERRISSVVDSAPFPIGVYTGKEMRILLANQNIIDVWGKGNDVIGKRYAEILPELENQEIFAQLDGVFTSGIPFHARNQRVDIINDGELKSYYFNYSFTPIFDKEGKIYGVMNTAADVTDLYLAKQELEQNQQELLDTKKRLEQELEAENILQRQKDDFISMASHELKTPLTAIAAIIQVLSAKLKQSTDPFISMATDKAYLQVKRMTSLINSFLNISRLESGKLLIEKKPFRMDDLISESVDEIRLIAADHILRIVHSDRVEVLADRDKIGSVILNLLSNAVKYSPRGKFVDIESKVINQQIRVSVRDEGMGVKSEDLGKVFDRYYRVESTHSKLIAGFGIGLYLSAEIIKQHGGSIDVESEPGKGSLFYFSIPLKQ